MKKKIKRYENGGEISSGLEHLETMAKRYGERPSKLAQMRAEIRESGRAGMAAAKEAVDAMPQIRGAKELASRVKIPKSYDEEKGMKSGGKVSSASKRADGIAIKGKTKGRFV